MTRYLFFFALVACGSPFNSRIEEVVRPDASADSEPAGDVAAKPDHRTGDARPDRVSPLRDGGGLDGDAAPADSGTDTSDPPHEAGHDAVPPPEDSGCMPFVSADPSYCGSEIAPGSYCVIDETSGGAYPATTPSECLCAATYTCTCILAHVASACSSHGTTVVSCVGGGLDGNLPTVTCE